MVYGVVLLVVLLSAAGGAAAFEGRVVDGAGRPVAAAEVTILGRTGATRTDADGRFTWVPDPQPPFEVLVIAPGGVYMKPLLVERLPAGVLELTVEPLVREVVTVSGSAGSIDTTPAAGMATLTAAEVHTRSPANLVQALENVAGVTQVSDGQAAVPAVRGLARGRTLILVDGARVSTERRVGPSATYLDPDVIEGIEVARGPGSVAYGSDAFGGVISVRTRTIAPKSPLGLRASGTLGAGIPDRRASLALSRGFDGGGLLLVAHARHVGDYRSPDGVVANSGYADRGLLGRATHQAGRGLLSAGWQSDFGRDIGRPRDNSHVVRFFYPRENSHRFTVSYDLRDLGAYSRVLVTGFVGSYGQLTDQDRLATSAAPRRVERADVAANDFHVRASAERPLGSARLEFGVDVNGRFGLRALDIEERYARDGTLDERTAHVSVDRAARRDTGLYASLEASVSPALSLAAGVRVDAVTTRNRGGYFGDRATSDRAGSGFLAVTAKRAGLSATAQVARGFRDPVLSDRYFRGPSGRGFVTGNPGLESESSLQLDLGVRYTAPRLRAAAYVFQYRIDDLVERYAVDTDVFLFRNRGRARVRGMEIEAQATPGRGLSLEAAFQATRGLALDDGAFLDDMAPETLSIQARKDLGVRGAFAQLRAAFVAGDARPGPTERVAPGSTLLDAAAGVGLVPGLELRLAARNLLDDRYLASQDVRAVAAPGRSISLTAVVRIGREAAGAAIE